MDATEYITTVAEQMNKASEEYITANQEFILDPEADTEMKLDRVMACKDSFYAFADIGTPPEEYTKAHEQFVKTAIKAGDLIEESVSLMRSYLNEELEGDYDDLSGELANELEDAFAQLSEDYMALVTIYQEYNLESPSISYEN
jgi:uncharacterized membrane-anchored protein YjiN (DUF445 family)